MIHDKKEIGKGRQGKRNMINRTSREARQERKIIKRGRTALMNNKDEKKKMGKKDEKQERRGVEEMMDTRMIEEKKVRDRWGE